MKYGNTVFAGYFTLAILLLFANACVSVKMTGRDVTVSDRNTAASNCQPGSYGNEGIAPVILHTVKLDCLQNEFTAAMAAKKSGVAEILGADSPRTQVILTSLDQKSKAWLAANRSQYQQASVREAKEMKEYTVRAEQARADAERLALSQAIETKINEYEELKNAGPNNSACLRAKQTIQNLTNAQQGLNIASSFIPGLGQINDMAQKASPALNAARRAVAVYCVFDAVAAGNAKDAIMESANLLKGTMTRHPNPRTASREKEIINMARRIAGR